MLIFAFVSSDLCVPLRGRKGGWWSHCIVCGYTDSRFPTNKRWSCVFPLGVFWFQDWIWVFSWFRIDFYVLCNIRELFQSFAHEYPVFSTVMPWWACADYVFTVRKFRLIIWLPSFVHSVSVFVYASNELFGSLRFSSFPFLRIYFQLLTLISEVTPTCIVSKGCSLQVGHASV